MRYEIGQANRLGNRSSNEDRFSAFEDDRAVLLVLADGMGGHAGGEWAAQTLVNIAGDAFSLAIHPIEDPGAFFADVVEKTHRAIHEFAEENRLGNPPGTTGVLCLVQSGSAHWAHVGDSRLYLFRDGVPLYRTRDHSYVERLYSRGEIRSSDKSYHPMRNQITQCIGGSPQVPQVEVSKPTPLVEGDVILLCTDGLWSGLEDMQLATAWNSEDIEKAAHRLAEEAERNSYPRSDNISVLAMRILDLELQGEKDIDLLLAELASFTSPDSRPEPVKLQDAIDQIEQAIKKYQDEMNQ